MGVTYSAPFADAAVPSGAQACHTLRNRACKQAGPHCYYMAVMNFVSRAKPQLVAAGCVGEWFDPIWDFAQLLGRCRSYSRVASVCESPPGELQLRYEALVKSAGQEWAGVAVGDGTYLPAGGSEYLLLMAVLSGAPRAGAAVHGYAKFGGGGSGVEFAFDGSPSGEAGSVVVVVVRHMVALESAEDMDVALRRVTNAVSRWGDVLGGVFTFQFSSVGHAMSWNVCSGRGKPYGIVVCDSNFGYGLGLDTCETSASAHVAMYPSAKTLQDIICVVVTRPDSVQ